MIHAATDDQVKSQTIYEYDDTARTLTVKSDLHAFNDQVLKTASLYDGLGRAIETRQYEGGGNYIAVQTEYDALGRPFKTSNPFRPWQSQTAVWTTQAFDALGRVISVTTPDNAVVSTSYSGNSVTVTDQAGKARKSVTDALGRLIDVYEDPNGLNYQTTYLYDILDNLVKVTQGSQQRFFMYDSLKRLIRARNPEQSTLASLALSDPINGNSAWSIGYQYDPNGNLLEKTDARGVVSTYAYDALNRNTTINYSDTSLNPDVTRFYDGAMNGKGQFWYFYSNGDFSNGPNAEAMAIDSYDALGRPLVKRQLFKINNVWPANASYQTTRAYNLAGGVTSQTYPSGHTVSYSYDAAGRTLSFSGNLGDSTSRTYANDIDYSPFGGLTREQFGTNTPLYHKSFYNIRGQLFDTRLSSVNDTWDWNRGRLILYYSSNHVWGQSGTDNNGNVRFAEVWIPPENATLDQADTLIEDSYNYDALNRLTSVAEQRMSVAGGWGVWQQQFRQAYSYDRYGNRTIDGAQTWGAGINNKQFDVETATNRLKVPGGQSGVMTYDSAGNLTSDTYTGAGAREYDAENRMTRAWGGNNQWQYYTYNADGQRMRRKVDDQETWQVYGFEGELLAEYAANGAAASPQKEYGYRNGEVLITADGPSGIANLALNKPTSQSSEGWGGASSRAVDGNTDGNWVNNSVTHTYYDNQAWWRVDLGTTYSINTVELWNRTDCCADRLTNFYVVLLDANYAIVNSVNVPGQGGYPTTISISGAARWVVVHLVGTNYLSLAEVKVWGTAPTAGGTNAVTDFSTGQNPNGAWSYGYKTGSTASFTGHSSNANLFGGGLDSWSQGSCCPMITHNATGTTYTYPSVPSVVQPADVLNLHPGPTGEVSVVRWTATAGGTYTIAGRFQGIDTGGTTTDVSIRQNAMVVWTGNINGYGNQAAFSSSVTVAAGDVIDFQVGYGSNNTYNSDSTGLAVTITPAGTTANVKWLVTDHLGTPRMVIDETGTLANIKRHDYLPFGEELFAPAGGRSAALGYAGGDGVRQQFTSKERDNETGLDYSINRYYSPTQGRFTSVDPLLESGESAQPQSWNRYSYSINNPLRFVDPDGLRYVQRTLADGTIQYGWCATDECYNNAIDTKGKNYAGWTAVTFDESKPFEYTCACGGGGDRYGQYRLNPDGTNGYADVLDGNYHAMSTDWNAQLAIGGLLRGLMGALGGLFDALAGGAAKSTTQAATTQVARDAIEIVAKDGTKITGLTKHGVNRVIGDGGKRAGTRPEAILDALKNPTKIKEGVDKLGRPFKVYQGANARVVVNPQTGKIVSTNPLSRAGAN